MKKRSHRRPRPERGARPPHRAPTATAAKGGAPKGAGPAGPQAATAPALVMGPPARPSAVARWARRFRRLAAVVALPHGEPAWGALRSLENAKHGGIGIPRACLAGASESTNARFADRPYHVLEHPDEGLARLAKAAGPRAPAHIVEGAVHALAHSAPLVLVNERDASAVTPLVCHTVATPSPAIAAMVARELDSILRSASAAVQDSYGQIDKPGQAIRDLAQKKARESTLEGLLVRLTRARKVWAEKDAPRRFRRFVDVAERDAEAAGRTKEEAALLAIGQPVALGYLDLLPLILTRLGPTGELAPLFERPLALMALGLVPVVLIEDPAVEKGKRRHEAEDDL